MDALLRGHLDRHSYCLLLRSLHAIYAALEPALREHASNRLIAPLQADELFRQASLENDLGTLYGGDWAASLPLARTAVDYTHRLTTGGAAQPALLLAHAYVRYLGDLSGGQVLQGIVKASLALEGDRGTRFYRFDGSDARSLAARFRCALDTPVLTGEEMDAIVEEARWAFSAHTRLFEELADRPTS